MSLGRLVSPSCLSKDIEESTDWIKVQYKFNRGIIHHGDMPHMSSVIQSIKPYINQPLPLSLPLAAPLATGGASSTKTAVKDNVIAGNGVFQTESRSDLNSSSGPTPLESSVINNLNTSNSKNKNYNENMQENQNHREIESENEDKNENENETLIENLVISYDEKVESPSSVEENEGSRIEGIDGGVRMTRVILGFNCFPNDQGSELEECCRRAPEHSGEYQFEVKDFKAEKGFRKGMKLRV